MPKRPIAFLILLLATLMLLAACGDPAPNPTPTTATATATGTSSNPPDTTSPTSTAATDTQPAAPPSGDGIDISNLDPCTLITQAEAEAIMGPLDWKIDPPTNTVDEKRCNFAEAKIIDADNIQGKTLEIVIWPLSYWEMQVAVNGGNPVTGIGDESFTQDAIQWLMQWTRYNNKAIVEVHVYPKTLETARQITALVAEKLK